jgi:hypothetical protein
MNSVGNWKSSHLRNLFKTFKYSLMQSLSICGVTKTSILYFKVQRSLKFIWKNLNWLGPTCQRLIYRSAGQTGYLVPPTLAIGPVTRWWPHSRQRGRRLLSSPVVTDPVPWRPYPRTHGRRREPSAPFSPTRDLSPLCSLSPLPSPLLTSATADRHSPLTSMPWVRAVVASSSARAQLQLDAPATEITGRLFFLTEVTVDSNLSSLYGRAKGTTSTTWVRSSPTNQCSSPTTSYSSRHRPLHCRWVPHHRPIAIVSIPPSNHPQSVTCGPVVLPGNTLPSPSLPAGRIRPAKPPAATGKSFPLFLVSVRKSLEGWAIS